MAWALFSGLYMLGAEDDEGTRQAYKEAVVDLKPTAVLGPAAEALVDGAKKLVRKAHAGGVSGYVLQEDLDQLNMSTVPIPANFAGLEAVDVPTRLAYQYFDIVEVTENEDYVEIRARHIWYRNLRNNTLWKPDKDTQYTGAAACRNILTNAVFPAGVDVASDCTDTLPGKELDFERKNIVEAFLDPEKGLCKKFGLSLIRDNTSFYCLKEVGYDRGYLVQNKKNLLGVERVENIENVVTRVAPVAKDSKGELIWLDYNGQKFVDSQYIADYPTPLLEILDTGLQVGKNDVTPENVQEKLLAAAQKRFSVDHADLPEVTMTVEFLALGDTEEYAQYRGLDKVYLYDIITIRDTVRWYNYSAQVIGVEHDILTGQLISVTIGSLRNADASRKIAVWQVPEVDGSNIRLLSIQAGAFEPGAINATDLATGSIMTVHLASATIDNLTAGALEAAAAHIHDLIAGSITADDIQAGSITTTTLAAGSVTAEKLAAGAVEADKIQAGAITAAKIDTQDLSAIQATLQIANIASATIASADIDYAQVKDLNAQSAYFGQAVIQAGLANKLYVPRLSVGYAQMIGATVGDLVVQASNGNFYAIDVDLDGNVTATQRNVSQSEIESGHTTDGRQLVMDTDILAENLTTNNLTASHALMYSITANIIDVDQLWAREAFVNKLMVQDISSNTYIQSTIGNWQSQSTITQTINGINSRITSLGYGTFFYQTTPPDPSGVVVGDVWIEPIEDNTWDDIAQYTWDELGGMTWEQVAGQYRMYVWTGTDWKLLFDNMIVAELQTQINQNAYAITLKADQTQVNTLSGQVTQFAATLEVQAQEISAAVSSVNQKGSNYVRLTDPADDPQINLNAGDTWTKAAGNGTWDSVADYTWDEIADLTWDELAGAKTYTWTGSEWILSADAGATVVNRALIEESDRQITLLVEETETIGGLVSRNSAQITIQSDRITQEVERATTAENGKINKTTQFQTADEIYAEAVSQSASSAAGLYLAKTTSYQTADAIVNEAVRQAGTSASNSYIAKTTTYQTADSIKNEAVRVAGVNAGNAYIAKSGTYSTVNDILAEAQAKADAAATTAKNASIAKTSTYQSAQAIVNAAVAAAATSAGATYIAKTTTYQTADAIVSAAESYTNGMLTSYSTTTQTNSLISAYVTNNAYGKVSGISITANGIDISGSQYVKIASGGYLQVKTGNFGIDTNAADYVLWSGAASAASSNFRLKKNGELTVTKLMILGENGTETEYNLRSGNLWKLNYQTIKQATITTDSSGYCTGFTLSNGTTVNFKNAASVDFASESLWSNGSKTLTLTNGKTKTVTVPDPADGDWSGSYIGIIQGTPTMAVSVLIAGKSFDGKVNASGAYSAGQTAAGLSATWNGATLSVSRVADGSTKNFSTTISGTWNSNTYQVKRDSTLLFGTTVTAAASLAYDATTHTYTATPTASAGGSVRHTGTAQVSGTEAYDSGYSNGNAAGLATGRGEGWSLAAGKYANSMSGGQLTITYAGSGYDTTATQTFKVAGLTAYARAGQTAYQYEGGRLVSFTIPETCQIGNAYITTA